MRPVRSGGGRRALFLGLALAGVPLLLWLGVWQWERGDAKARLLELRELRAARPPVPLGQLAGASPQRLHLSRVMVQGTMDEERVFLLDNRVRQGRAGYEVLIPMYYDAKSVVLLNRGWIAAGASRQELPRVPVLPGRQRLYGRIHVPRGAPLVLGAEESSRGWPRVVQDASPAVLAKYFPGWRMFPYELRLEPSAAPFLARWPSVTRISAARHRGYALQWFALSALLLLYIFFVWRRGAAVWRRGAPRE